MGDVLLNHLDQWWLLEGDWQEAEQGRSVSTTMEVYRESGVEKVSSSWSILSSLPFTEQRGHNPGQEQNVEGVAGIQLLSYPQSRSQASW